MFVSNILSLFSTLLPNFVIGHLDVSPVDAEDAFTLIWFWCLLTVLIVVAFVLDPGILKATDPSHAKANTRRGSQKGRRIINRKLFRCGSSSVTIVSFIGTRCLEEMSSSFEREKTQKRGFRFEVCVLQ